MAADPSTNALVSAQIDANLRAESRAAARREKPIRVLIFGQSGSGKSSLLTHFRMLSSSPSSEYGIPRASLGIEEYRMEISIKKRSRSFIFYTLSGTGTQRLFWASHLDDIDAIIFLAPLSAFDETLQDSHVNCLEDSFLLWQAITSSTLLRKIPLILLLNKCDILEQKLTSGVQFSQFVLSYGSRRPNDFESVKSYLRYKFDAVHRSHSHYYRHYICRFVYAIDSELSSDLLRTIMDLNIIQKNIDLMTPPPKKQPSITSSIKPNQEEKTENHQTEQLYQQHQNSSEMIDAESISLSQYSLASSRTADTDYGIYCRRMAYSQDTLESGPAMFNFIEETAP